MSKCSVWQSAFMCYTNNMFDFLYHSYSTLKNAFEIKYFSKIII